MLNTFKKTLWLLERIERTSLVYVWSTRGGWMQLASTTSCRHLRMGRGCEAAALTAELLTVAFLNSETVEEVYQVLSLTDAHLDPDSWVPKWFLSLADPTSICLSGWHVFFRAVGKALEFGTELAACQSEQVFAYTQEALGLLAAAAESAKDLQMLLPTSWQQAVGQRILKRPAASRFWASQQSTPWCRDAARCWVLWINQSLKTFEKAFVIYYSVIYLLDAFIVLRTGGSSQEI